MHLRTNACRSGFTPDGRRLVVPLRAANVIDTFAVNADGSVLAPVPNVSSGPTPFGFEFDARGHLVISDVNAGVAGGSALSSYRVDRDGSLTRLDGGVTATTRRGPTDLALSSDGRFVVNVNGGSDTLTVFAIASGRLAHPRDDRDGPPRAGARHRRQLSVLPRRATPSGPSCPPDPPTGPPGVDDHPGVGADAAGRVGRNPAGGRRAPVAGDIGDIGDLDGASMGWPRSARAGTKWGSAAPGS